VTTRLSLLAWLFAASVGFAGDRALIDTSRSPRAKMQMVNLGDTTWAGGLLGERFDVCRDTMIPHLWTIFQDDQESHAWSNFLIAAGEGRGRDGKFHGPPFNDGDFLKWLEAMAQLYAVTRDTALDGQMDRIIAVIAKAQREDGYLHTQTIIPQRQGDAKTREFGNREHFETYNMGHLMTTACIHYRATGKTTLLAAARKAADYLERLAARAPDELARNAICPSHYMGVIELHRVTREPRYLALARTLLDLRDRVAGTEVGSDHNQDRTPLRETLKAVGHAVRANYLYAGAADYLAEADDPSLERALTALATDVATRKLYFTGMTGALYDGASPDGSPKHATIKTVHQAYGRDFQLPNLTAYNETCATIGYAMWAWRMLLVTGDSRYADQFEQSLYNGVLAGISLEGKHYFYVNPLRTDESFDWPLRWSRTRTPNIKSSFCCPPNVVRTIAEAHNYVYTLSPDKIWVQLYAASVLNTQWPDGQPVRLRQRTDYPWDGAVEITLEQAPAKEFTLALRIPGWLPDGTAEATVNGTRVNGRIASGRYLELRRVWQAGDRVSLRLPFSPAWWEANPLVEETRDQVALRVGPIVYCAEANDLPAGVRLNDVRVNLSHPLATTARGTDEKIGSTPVRAWQIDGSQGGAAPWSGQDLYRPVGAQTATPLRLKFVPYFAWGNRGAADMTVWIPRR
jgi:DUF1680 family protein